MILTNGRVILADTIRDDLDVEVRDGKIADLRPRGAAQNAIDLGKNFLGPGFVDLHVHGALGRDAMEMSLESFRVICDYHGRGGTTTRWTKKRAPALNVECAVQPIHSIACRRRDAVEFIVLPVYSSLLWASRK